MTIAKPIIPPWLYTFNTDGTLEETSNPDLSTSPWFWLTSGGFLKISGGQGHTNQGELTSGKWYDLYRKNNPTDTDQGKHPQNVFRMVTHFADLHDVALEVTVTVRKMNLSASSSRNATNGIHLMLRYQDQENLYYAGIRADGQAMIKRKSGGNYSNALASARAFPGTWNRDTNPCLLPIGTPIRIRAIAKDGPSGVWITMQRFVDGAWKTIISVIDSSTALRKSGRVGIRTDFMDCDFEDFRITTA